MNSPSLLKIGFSPCPNDTFIFDAIIHQRIDTEGLLFSPQLEDVETLNNLAMSGELDITKLSFPAFGKVAATYQLLNSGSALGKGVGPLLISLNKMEHPEEQINKVAIPGKNTTANFLFTSFFPSITNKVEMVFSDIENAVLDHSVDAGVIIHENRFTYADKGLTRICDLGELWEQKTGMPVPLGGIAIKRNFPDDLKKKVNRIIRRSVEFAFANPEASKEYVAEHAQEMNPEVRRQHISLYVNNYTVDLGQEGKEAISEFLDQASKKGLLKLKKSDLFVL